MVEYVGPIQQKRGTSAQWTASSIPLRDGELGIDTTLRRMKVGDGVSLFPALPWFSPDQATIEQLQALAAAVEGAVTPTDAVMTAVAADEDSAFAQAQRATIGEVSQGLVDEAVEALPASFATVQAGRPGNRTVFLGDSITRGGGDEPEVGGGGLAYRGQSFPSMSSLLSNERIHFIRNSGVPGNNTSQMVARFPADVAAHAPNCVAIMAGTNDVGQGIALATTTGNLTTLVEMTRAIGAVPVLFTIAPTEEASPAGRKAKVAVLNQWIREYAAGNGIPLIDAYALWVDEATGGWKSAYKLDNTHPNTAGNFALAQKIAASLAPLLPAWEPPVPVDAGDPNNLVLNPLFLTDSNADGLADNWSSTVLNGAVYSIVADAAIPGSWQQMAAAAVAGTTQVYQGINSIIPGHKYRFIARMDVSGVASGLGAIGRLRFQNASSGGIGDLEILRNMVQPVSGIAMLDGVAPPNTTKLQVAFQMTAGTGTHKVAQVGVYDLTAMGLA